MVNVQTGGAHWQIKKIVSFMKITVFKIEKCPGQDGQKSLEERMAIMWRNGRTLLNCNQSWHSFWLDATRADMHPKNKLKFVFFGCYFYHTVFKFEIVFSSHQRERHSEDESRLYRTPPSVLYNGMIAPLVGMTVRAALWYQGEANVRPGGRANYACRLPVMIQVCNLHGLQHFLCWNY